MKKTIFYILLFLIFCLGFVLRLKCYILNPSLWQDESLLALNIKHKSYLQMFGVLDSVQVAPPFFMIFTKMFVQLFGWSERVFRFIPFISGILSLIGFYFLSKKVLKTEFAILVSLLLCSININLIMYSNEFKPYELDVFFTILSLLFFVNLNLEEISVKKSFLFGMLISLIPWISFAPSFVILSGFILLLIKDKKRFFQKKIALILPFFISGLMFLFYASTNYASSGIVSWWSAYRGFAHDIMHLFYLIVHMLLYLFHFLYDKIYFHNVIFVFSTLLFVIILFIWGIILLSREKSDYIKLVSLTYILLIILSALSLYPMYGRLILFLIPINLLLVTKPLDLISVQDKVKSIFVVSVAIIAFLPQSIALGYFKNNENLTKREYNREMMYYMAKRIKPTDTVFVDSAVDSQYLYYNQVFNIKNNVISNSLENLNLGSKNIIAKFKKGYYWLYLSSDSIPKQTLNNLVTTKKIAILYSFEKQRSKLLYIRVN